MRKIQMMLVLFLSLILVSSTAGESERESDKCSYLPKVHNSVNIEEGKKECPYLSSAKGEIKCPYMNKEKINESKKAIKVCPYSKKTDSVNKVKNTPRVYHQIELDKS